MSTDTSNKEVIRMGASHGKAVERQTDTNGRGELIFNRRPGKQMR